MKPSYHMLGCILVGLLISGFTPVATSASPQSKVDFGPSQASIESSLLFSTYLGGDQRLSDDDRAAATCVGPDGGIFVVIYSETHLWPLVNAYQDTYGGGESDIVLVELSSDGSTVLYCTFLGGDGLDFPQHMVVDDARNVYIAGSTNSSNIATPGAFDESHNGERDIFIMKFTPDTNTMHYWTYVGGSDSDEASSLAVDSGGNAYVTGYTRSGDFPVTNGIDDSLNGTQDAFVLKLNSEGDELSFSTFLGGVGVEWGSYVTQGPNGSLFVTGHTESHDFYCTEDAYDSTLNGTRDGFVVKLEPDGSDITFSTLVGGLRDDQVLCSFVDDLGCAYLAGTTRSSDFPIVDGLADEIGGDADSFVLKLSPDGSEIFYSTYVGGEGDEEAWHIAVDNWGCVYIAGKTYSDDYPVANAFDEEYGGEGDCFLTKLDIGNNSVLFSTYIGGDAFDCALRFDFDSAGNIIVCGYTSSDDFPTTSGSFQEEYYANWDAFLIALHDLGDMDLDGLNEWAEYLSGTMRASNDTESDGMPDGWEVTFGLDPLVDDADLDKDGDGLSNLGEFQNRTDPTFPDSDLDGIPDGWEVHNGYDPGNEYIPLGQLLHYNLLFVIVGLVVIVTIPTVYFIRPRLVREKTVEVSFGSEEETLKALEELIQEFPNVADFERIEAKPEREELEVDLSRLRELMSQVDRLLKIEHTLEGQVKEALLREGVHQSVVGQITVEFLTKERASLDAADLRALGIIQEIMDIPSPDEIRSMMDAQEVVEQVLRGMGRVKEE
ncbi:MAG: SBBP repeat-containing protein [Candidatus Thorarchaeota archaeon]|nr:MAG: SBBP repeat-containing protein [Candidatus Thorarchaeota archaeon]